MSKKRSGRVRLCNTQDEDYPFQFSYWDDWIDCRDGMRDKPSYKELKKKRLMKQRRQKIQYNQKNRNMRPNF